MRSKRSIFGAPEARSVEIPQPSDGDTDKGNIRREAGGSSTLDFRTKSGGTASSGGTTGIGPGATYEWRGSFFPVDPNTGVEMFQTKDIQDYLRKTYGA